MENKNIGLFVGSLRKDANSKKIAKNLIDMTPEGFDFQVIEIGQLPLYNQDFDDDNEVPESYAKFRKTVKELDGFIFITPEYNRSVPAVLKNAVDVGSRPPGESVWGKKPGAVISSSRGNLSGFGANHHLRQSLCSVNIYTLAQPEVYLAKLSPESFNEDGSFKEQRTLDLLKKFVDAYVDWFKQLTK